MCSCVFQCFCFNTLGDENKSLLLVFLLVNQLQFDLYSHLKFPDVTRVTLPLTAADICADATHTLKGQSGVGWNWTAWSFPFKLLVYFSLLQFKILKMHRTLRGIKMNQFLTACCNWWQVPETPERRQVWTGHILCGYITFLPKKAAWQQCISH